MPRERNSVKVDFALTTNDDVQDFIIRMLRHKVNDMQFEKEYYEAELRIAADQKKVNLSNGRKYSELYQEKLDRIQVEIENFEEAMLIVSKTEFPQGSEKVKSSDKNNN